MIEFIVVVFLNKHLIKLLNKDYTNVPLLTQRLVRDLPAQSIILGEATFWSLSVQKIIESKNIQDLTFILYE